MPFRRHMQKRAKVYRDLTEQFRRSCGAFGRVTGVLMALPRWAAGGALSDGEIFLLLGLFWSTIIGNPCRRFT